MKTLFLAALLALFTTAFAAEREAQLLTGNALISDGDSHERQQGCEEGHLLYGQGNRTYSHRRFRH
jgi:hypothetical protein